MQHCLEPHDTFKHRRTCFQVTYVLIFIIQMNIGFTAIPHSVPYAVCRLSIYKLRWFDHMAAGSEIFQPNADGNRCNASIELIEGHSS